MPSEKLDQLLNDAALWSGYAETQLGLALTLRDRGIEEHRVLEALEAAHHGLGRAAAAAAEFIALLGHHDTEPPPAPGAE